MVKKISNIDAFCQSSDNVKFLEPVRLPKRVIMCYSYLMIYFPLSEKKIFQYNNLKYNQKAGFLFRYMLKCAYQTRIHKPLIEDLISTKQRYDSIQKDYNDNKLGDNDFLIDKVKKSTLEDMRGDIEIMLDKKKLKEIFEDKMVLMADLIFTTVCSENERKRKIEEIFEIN